MTTLKTAFSVRTPGIGAAYDVAAVAQATRISAALRRDVFIESDLLVRVYGAQEAAAGVERRPDLLVRELRAALGAGALDHRFDAGLLFEVHQELLPTT